MSAQGGQGGKRQSGPKSRTSDFWGVTQVSRHFAYFASASNSN